MTPSISALVCLLVTISQAVSLENNAPAAPEGFGETIMIRSVEELRHGLRGEPRGKPVMIADGMYTLGAPTC